LSFDLWGFTGPLFFSAPPGLLGWGLIAFFTSLILLGLVGSFNSIVRLSARQWLGFVLLLWAGGLLAQLLILRIPATILPPPGLPIEPQRPGLALFALVPAFLAGGWLGVGPALIVGVATGVARSGWESYSLLTPLIYGFAAWLFAWCVRQRYWGWPGRLLRHPVAASLVVAALLAALDFPAYYAYSRTSGLEAADHVWSQTMAAAPVSAAMALLAGVIAMPFKQGLPAWWPEPESYLRPPYVASLNRKLLYVFGPLFLLAVALMFWANIAIAAQVATGLVVDQMSSAASTASRGIPFFIHTGQSLINNIAAEDGLLAAEPGERNVLLAHNLRAVPYFRQLTLLDAALLPVAGYPAGPDSLPQANRSEHQMMRLALGGVPQNAVIHPDRLSDPVDVVFAVPIYDADGEVGGVLVGRADLSNSPLMQPVINSLTGLAGPAGQGFILDENGAIIFHPDSQRLMQTFELSRAGAPLSVRLAGARAVQDKAPDGTRRLSLVYPVPGHAWNVAVTVPYFVVLEQAWEISKWAVITMALIGTLGLLLISYTANRVTRPAVTLAQAAQRIAEGELDKAVAVGDPDEIGRAALAFEGMRLKLRARLLELGMLLDVSQSVAASLNLEDALPPILRGALATTGAAGARLILLPQSDARRHEAPQPTRVFAAGRAAELMAPMDRGVLQTTRDEGPAIIENLARARTVLDVSAAAGKLFAVLAMPLRLEKGYYGALWLAWDQPRTISDSEINLVQTLAGQAAVAAANARLFDDAEQGRQLLAAILASTPDAVIVTDRNERLLLVNPAAEQAFDLAGPAVVGRPLAQVLPAPELARLMQANGSSDVEPSVQELTLPNGRTLSASASPIIGADGSMLGRVCVLRDVTHFKELNEMKSEFVATVSHDLRAPLTFMRGYISMLPMVGPLNAKQAEFADKIVAGVAQMTVLIDDLLDLGRIEAGVGLEREPVQMALVIR
jgi:PAS domain S-box-containing protein